MAYRYQFHATDAKGNARPGAYVRITDSGTGALSTIYEDEAGSVPKANPFTADADGYAFFYAASAVYNILAYTAGYSRLWSDVVVGGIGATGAAGATGPAGPAGADGQGVPTGGSTGQALVKASGTNYDTVWGTSGALSVETQRFTSSGTYTPTSGMKYCIIECVGGGGGGGGTASAPASRYAHGGGGGGGEYSKRARSAAQVGASQTVTIGGGGAGGVAGFSNGNPGTTTSVGTLCTAAGGSGGLGNDGSTDGSGGGAGGTGGTSGHAVPGQPGMDRLSLATNGAGPGAAGGNSTMGWGARPRSSIGTGSAGSGYGGGGGGGISYNSGATAAGGVGSAGVVVITEFIQA